MTIQPDSHLKVGDRAPDFTLNGSPPGDFTLSKEIRRRPIVLYFYVSDFGIMCNIAIKALVDRKDELDRYGVELVGISVDDPRMHGIWQERMRIPFRLLSDTDGRVSRLYGVLMMDGLYQKLSNRALFLIDQRGIIRYKWVARDPAYEPDVGGLLGAIGEMSRDQ